ncbi:hypothetical protein BGX27_007330 [Mortierella sp. AM989]|nr:hypothetical protein BGX27_007330 [Mortierella sp. AM989]
MRVHSIRSWLVVSLVLGIPAVMALVNAAESDTPKRISSGLLANDGLTRRQLYANRGLHLALDVDEDYVIMGEPEEDPKPTTRPKVGTKSTEKADPETLEPTKPTIKKPTKTKVPTTVPHTTTIVVTHTTTTDKGHSTGDVDTKTKATSRPTTEPTLKPTPLPIATSTTTTATTASTFSASIVDTVPVQTGTKTKTKVKSPSKSTPAVATTSSFRKHKHKPKSKPKLFLSSKCLTSQVIRWLDTFKRIWPYHSSYNDN